ncbi:MAG TPA: amidase [Gaiellaceae bacterium]|jgi:aspartyl-tRNA(Asn)/glutamyl-tRNA(Gln) amidotransferase subunit A|nr:amidase [Gaiellaceae bacterium]
MAEPSDLGVLDAADALRRREVSARELVDSCLARIEERDGTHSADGDPASVNAWVRVYEEDARAQAARADARLVQDRLAHGEAPPLCGIPIGLKDLYAVAGKPLTASSKVLDDLPDRDCDVWKRLRDEGMVLLGHLHTHEFAAGGTTDQVGNPWALERTAGGSSGGSAAALASRMTPAATGTDTAGSLRIPSALCGTSTIKPTRGFVPMRGIVPLCPTLDHAGPMARTVADCEPLLAAMAATEPPAERSPLRRVAVSPRVGDVDPDAAEGFERALAALPVVEIPPPLVELELGTALIDFFCAEMLPYHRRFDGRRDLYRQSTRDFLEHGERRPLSAEQYVDLQSRRAELTAAWADWFDEHRVDAILEPTVPLVARERGHGYDRAFTDYAEISLTHYWDWTGFPAVSLPSGIGSRSGLPTSVSLIGAPGADWDLLAWGAALQSELGVPAP